MIDVMIISFNEALNLPHCLQALQGWTNNVFVIDSGSTDGTQEIARSMNAQVVHHAWEGYARQKNWGLRIDHLLLSPQASDRLVDVGIDSYVRAWEKPSDHVPIWCELGP